MRHSCSVPGQGAQWLRVASLLMLSTLLLSACGGSEQPAQQRQQPPVPVDVTTVQPHSVDIFSEYPGRVEGKRTVQVLARVEGVLLERHYTEGQIVKKGQLLYTIDPKPFQATVNQRKAAVASAKASLNQAQRQWSRVRQLFKANAISAAERDQALSSLETARASVQQARANLDSAEIDLGYTKVKAPLTGVTSLREIDEGSLVQNGTRLTTITQLDPVYVLFALPEDDALARGKALSEMGSDTTDADTREATILLSNGEEYPIKGVVDFTQSTIDPNTGTVQLRAVVKNTGNVLMPGRYVRARIRLETRPNALVVPNVAVSDGQGESQVFVVSDAGKAKAVSVKLGPDVADGRVINDGLSAGDRVITSGLGQLRPGAPVKVKSGGGHSGQGGKPQGKSPSAASGEAKDAKASMAARAVRRNLRLSDSLAPTRLAASGPRDR